MTIKDVNKNDCCGCSLCATICVEKCIRMIADEDGFEAPIVDDSKCVNCGLCYKKCPATKEKLTTGIPRYFTSIIADKDELLSSSSGGVFIALAKYILAQGGYVCGCVWDENIKAVHICSDKLEDVHRMMGSKYVQSTIENVLPIVKQLINQDKVVLFTGTACQLAAVKALLPNANNLYLVDVLCHGVPSPLFFRKYKDYLEDKHGGKLVNIEFRNKKIIGWGSEHRTYYEINKNGKVKGYYPILPAYFCSFFYGTNLRESCYRCKYAGESRISDITIGDYWGYWKYYRRMFPEGISVVSVNSSRGIDLFSKIKEQFSFCDEISPDSAKISNTNFFNPTLRCSTRDYFYKNIRNNNSSLIL